MSGGRPYTRRFTRWSALLAVLMLVIVPAFAQDGGDTPLQDYPTATALQTTTIPPADFVDIARRLQGVRLDASGEDGGEMPRREVGMQEDFWVSNSVAQQTFQVPATLAAIGEHVYIWVQEGGGVSADGARQVAAMFDTQVYEPVRALWGSEASPGVDDDPRLHILFARNLGGNTGAYFALRHTYPREVMQASNEREMFIVSLDAYHPDFTSLDALESVLAHEFQHMIRYHQDGNQDTWLNEGFSTFTELYLGSTSPNRYPSMFLSQPGTQLNTFGLAGQPRGANYGAGFLFVTYFHARYGDDAIRALSDETSTGLMAVDNVLRDLGEPGVNSLFADWVVANLIQAPESAFGYPATLPMLPVPVTTPPEPNLPHGWIHTINQYSTRYYEIALQAPAIDLRLEMAPTVRLVPTTAASGQRMWWSNRADTSSTRLTRRFDLSDVDEATLRFKTWYAIEELWDFAYVQVSTDGGESWTLLESPAMTTENPFGNNRGVALTGYSDGWIEQTISLDDYTGGEVLIRFEYLTDDAVNEHGLVLDDIAIPEIDYRADFETDDGGWQAEGWVLIDNLLPQQAWVQAVQFTDDGPIVIGWLAEGSDEWTLDVDPTAHRVIIAVSPFAPVTTVPTEITLRVDRGG